LRLSARPVLGAFGHHHQNCQKNVHTSESSGKGRRRMLSKNSVNSSSDGEFGGYFVLCGRLSATPVLGAFGHHHQNCQKNVHTSESSGKGRRRILSKNSVNSSSDGESGGYFVLCGRLSATPVQGASGHHHKNCQKNVHTSEISGKRRRTRLSKNSVNSSSDGESGGYFVPCAYQLGLYWELSATTTRTARKTCTNQRVAERIGEQGYQKIVSIAVAMVAQ